MEIRGKIIKVDEIQSGVTSSGKEWASQEYVLETHDGTYARHMAFRVYGKDKIQQFAIIPDEIVTVSFDIDAREYNGKWYNTIKAWAVNRNAPQQTQAAQPAPQPQPAVSPVAAPAPVDESNLPF